MGDIDSGETFNNYQMYSSASVLNSVEVSEELCCEFGLPGRRLVCNRLLFGWRPSPLYAVRMCLRDSVLSKRSRYDKTSAFAGAHVELNLPGTWEYNPGQPRIMRIRSDGISIG